MADISSYLAAILAAVYGEDVRGSIHDAIEIINDVSEVVLSTGTAVTSASSSSTGFYTDSLYLNTNTYELWKCVGTDSWSSLGTLIGADGRGIVSITKTGTVGLVDTYTITYDSGSPTTFTVTNGANGVDGANGSVWYRGTAITGGGTSITGFPGNENDFYLNSSTGIVYVCTATGTAVTATWDYVMTLTGGGTGTTDYTDLSNKPQINSHTLTGNQTAADLGFATVATSGSYSDLSSKPTIPAEANNGTLTISQNGVIAATFGANQSSAATADIVTDKWHTSTATVSSGQITFSGVNDTDNNGYEVFFEITGNSTNKNPYATLNTMSGSGTSSMSVTYDTDADNGATAKLRIIR